MAIQTTLPDPNNRISASGDNASGSFGPGFASVTFKSNQPVISNKSNSGLSFRSVLRYHQWELDIKYNDLIEADFNIVYPFLVERQQSQEAFFVELPQYGNSAAGAKTIVNTLSVATAAGKNQVQLNNVSSIIVGDLFDLIDSFDSLHLKAYKVTRIDTANNKIFFSPGLQRKIVSQNNGGGTVTANFTRPRIRARVKGANLDYQVKANGLYSFSVNVEEALA